MNEARQPAGDSLGDPPFFLYCNYCRWDSAEVGITFDKPTGLARKHHLCGYLSAISLMR